MAFQIHRWCCVCALVSLVLPAGVLAQETPVIVPLEVERTASGQDYLSTLRFTRTQAEVVYVDSLEGKITVDTRLPEPQEEPSLENVPNLGNGVNAWGVVLLIALAVALLIVLRTYGGGLKARFAKDPEGEIPQVPPPGPGGPEARVAGDFYARLRGMADRREALVLLLRHVLAAAAQSNNLRHLDSETARELLRRLPSAWPKREQLR
ncbi:MAG: hypothetical protein AAF679_08520, partial [Pseudomonadota bacterium]